MTTDAGVVLWGAGEFLMGKRISIVDILFTSRLDWARFYAVTLPDYLTA